MKDGQIMKGIGEYLFNLRLSAEDRNRSKILDMLEENKKAKVLDLGCNDGVFTEDIAKRLNTVYIYGVEVMQFAILKSKQKGIETVKADANNNLPFANNSFDVIVSNQVIEHIIDLDRFVDEVYRILRPNGYAVISTENLSAVHNLFALFFGYQAFSQQISHKKYIRNPISHLYLDGTMPDYPGHMRILTYFGLKQLFELYGFEIDKLVGTGIYPFSPMVSRVLEGLDPVHANFITVKARKAVGP